MYWLLMILYKLTAMIDVGLLVSINHLGVAIIHVTLILLAVIYTSGGELLYRIQGLLASTYLNRFLHHR